jgi:DNA repair exonuclease SbcCD nuclease subunit
MKFVHAADIHLDSPLLGLRDYPGAPVDAIGDVTRLAFEALVELCLHEEVDLLVISGDIYDGDWRDMKTGLFLRSRLQRLREAGIEVALINGNHDAVSVISRNLSLPGINVLPAEEPGTVVFDQLGVAVHGQSYPTRAVTDDLAAAYPEPVHGLYNIGLLHTALQVGPGDERNYAPCRLDQLINHGYAYWALGHRHDPEVLNTDPHVVFAGVLQGRQIREAGPKGAYLVEVTDGITTAVEHRPLDAMRWERLRIDVSALADEADLLVAAREAMDAVLSTAGDRLLALRLEIVGAAPIHSLLVKEREHLDGELRALASEFGAERIWLERIVYTTEAPSSATVRDDALGGVLGILGQAMADDAVLEGLAQGLKPLGAKMPSAVKEGDEGVDPCDPETLRRVMAEVARDLPSLLSESSVA